VLTVLAMLPFDIPAGTTVGTLFAEVLPRLHRELVPADPRAAELRAVARVEGHKSYTLVVRGSELAVQDGEEEGAPLWVALDARAVQLFLDDWSGPRRLVPNPLPAAGVLLLTDPRLLRRVAMVNGRIELAMKDFPGVGRVAMTVGAGDGARKGIDTRDPDVVIEAALSSVERLLSGALSPEDALVDEHVTVRGKRFVAMQLALALAPLHPSRA
jgi:SCP-2 sterol transfer family